MKLDLPKGEIKYKVLKSPFSDVKVGEIGCLTGFLNLGTVHLQLQLAFTGRKHLKDRTHLFRPLEVERLANE